MFSFWPKDYKYSLLKSLCLDITRENFFFPLSKTKTDILQSEMRRVWSKNDFDRLSETSTHINNPPTPSSKVPVIVGGSGKKGRVIHTPPWTLCPVLPQYLPADTALLALCLCIKGENLFLPLTGGKWEMVCRRSTWQRCCSGIMCFWLLRNCWKDHQNRHGLRRREEQEDAWSKFL